jgi:hypothetical protein
MFNAAITFMPPLLSLNSRRTCSILVSTDKSPIDRSTG